MAIIHTFRQSNWAWWLLTSRPDIYTLRLPVDGGQEYSKLIIGKRGVLSVSDFDRTLHLRIIERVKYTRGILGWIMGWGDIELTLDTNESVKLEYVVNGRKLAELIDFHKGKPISPWTAHHN